ncbi:ThiF family adenylyltransferase [Pasteurellaceae bacterium LIM206]|nr:ThiF family adenylyltransferase [Pasteurellaceae bacterium LIM206]
MSILLKSQKDDEIYLKRVNRTLPFLGIDAREQQKAQERLSKMTVSIAGAGGIGGAMAVRLARFGIKKIKIADPDTFDYTNINRQLGANIENVGKNKAAVVGEMAYNIARDVDIEIFEEGITRQTAENFVKGCDLILDQVDFSLIDEKFALHQAFRNEDTCKVILACSVIGWTAHLYKFLKSSMPIEEWYDFPDSKSIASLARSSKTERMLKLWSPRFPLFPSYQKLLEWIKENDTLPIFAGFPPVAEGLLTQRVILCLLDKEYPPYATTLPPIPSIYIFDAAQLHGDIYLSDGHIKNQIEINNFNSILRGKHYEK